MPANPQQVDAEVRRIHNLADGGQPAEAEAEARAYLQSHTDSADAHFLLGYALFRQRKPKESFAEYTAVPKIRQPDASDLIAVGRWMTLLVQR